MAKPRPHILGIDDAPFDKGQTAPVPIVGVMMEGADLVESVAITAFPVDGADATGFLVDWVRGLRSHPALQAVIVGGITIAGLGVVEIRHLSEALSCPVLSVTRNKPSDPPLLDALSAAGFAERRSIVERSPRATRVDDGLYVARAGIAAEDAAAMMHASRAKARLPEALRVAHLIGRAIVTGESRGRV